MGKPSNFTRAVMRMKAVVRNGRADEDFDTEKAQALVRIVIVLLAIAYVLPAILMGATPIEARSVVWLLSYYIFFSLAAYSWIAIRPGESRLRRAVTIAHDLGALTYTIAVGGQTFLPLFAIMLWVTVGNGLRFGQAYLQISTAATLAGILAITYANAYWRHNPFMVLTLAATTILVPAYIYALLGRLRKAYDAAQEASLSKSRFLAQASHDLRQPIHAISLFTACLRDANLEPKELQMVENIDRSLQSVSRLFKSLLDISTLDSGRVTPKFERIAISEIIDDVLRQNREAAQQSHVRLRIVACNAIVDIDRALITTMVQNIVNNAIKYAAGRDVLVGCRRRGDRLKIQIADQGPGIALEHRLKVFDEFYQVRERGDKDVDGVGLGLPIVRRLGRLLDIDIDLQSMPDRGTCVTLANIRIVREQKRVQSPPPANIPIATVCGLRILLVEDDEAVLVATASLLRKWGCEVQAEATIPTQVAEFDLLITDFDLGGGVTGTECIRAVERITVGSVPAVVMSGHDEARVREDLGTRDIPILSKPVRPAELRSVVMAAALNIYKAA